jgi:hypothetical protein
LNFHSEQEDAALDSRAVSNQPSAFRLTQGNEPVELLAAKGIKSDGSADSIRFRRITGVLFAGQFTKKNICEIFINLFRTGTNESTYPIFDRIISHFLYG